jgi:small subunit ribosomal protein S16
MPAKIRLQRHGKKGKPFYHIVIADGRAPRDGRFIEKIGTYNPITKPADIVLDVDKALDWLNKGAQPTDTVRAILSYKGIMYKNHLLKGVKKGALTEEQAEAKFQVWLKEKEAKIAGTISEVDSATKADKKSRLEAEAKVNEARAVEISKRKAEEVGIVEKETPVEETKETPVEEAPVKDSEAKEAPVEKPKVEEAPVIEPKAEKTPEEKTPIEEAKAKTEPVKEEEKKEK